MISTVWHQAFARQPSPPYLLIILTGVAALIVVLERHLWRLARNAITIAHEGGHAFFAVLAGRRLTGIKLHSDTSGLTVSKGRPNGPGAVITLMMGYVMPSIVGIGLAALLAFRHVTIALWVCIALLIVMLLMIRNWFGVLALLITGGVIFLVSWYAPARVQSGFIYFAAWFLLLGAVRPLFELARQRRRGKAAGSDVDQLASMTGVPGGLWLTLFLFAGIGAFLFGAYLLGVLNPGDWHTPTA